jgi:hypothetical protein
MEATSHKCELNKDNLDTVKALVIEACDKVLMYNGTIGNGTTHGKIQEAVLRYKNRMVNGIESIQKSRNRAAERCYGYTPNTVPNIVWSDKSLRRPEESDNKPKTELGNILLNLKTALMIADGETWDVKHYESWGGHDPFGLPNSDELSQAEVRDMAGVLNDKTDLLRKQLFPLTYPTNVRNVPMKSKISVEAFIR